MVSKEEKLKALNAAITQIEKDFGKGSIMRIGDNGGLANVSWESTGVLGLDLAMGGGIPKGRIIEVYGPESSGKTTIALHMAAAVQKTGGICAFIDAEHALDPIYAKNIGVDIDNLYISQPDSGEQALEITETLIRSGAVNLVVVDSVAALVPKAEIDGDMGDAHVGLQARLMSQAEGDLLRLAEKEGIVKKSGAWYSYNGQNVGQGTEKTKEWLRNNPEAAMQIEAQIRDNHSVSDEETETIETAEN